MRLFGLVGYPLSHSFSKKYFDEKFIALGVPDCRFENFSIEHIDLLGGILKDKNLKGLSVTSPHKKSVIIFLDEMSEIVKQMGACNCIRITDGKLYGYNTDVIGFEKSFTRQLTPRHKQALILGNGGAAAAVEFVLKKLHIPYRFVSRQYELDDQVIGYSELDKAIFEQYQIIINTSPLGTYPNIDECPSIPYHFITPDHYFFDLVYNPAESKFLRLASQHGAATRNGYEMLQLQAEENWLIWNGF